MMTRAQSQRLTYKYYQDELRRAVAPGGSALAGHIRRKCRRNCATRRIEK